MLAAIELKANRVDQPGYGLDAAVGGRLVVGLDAGVGAVETFEIRAIYLTPPSPTCCGVMSVT